MHLFLCVSFPILHAKTLNQITAATKGSVGDKERHLEAKRGIAENLASLPGSLSLLPMHCNGGQQEWRRASRFMDPG